MISFYINMSIKNALFLILLLNTEVCVLFEICTLLLIILLLIYTLHLLVKLTSKLLPLHAASTGVNAQNKSLASLNIFLRSPASARSFVLPSLAGEEFDCYLLLKESPPAPRAKRDGLQSQDNWEDIHFHTLSAELSSV